MRFIVGGIRLARLKGAEVFCEVAAGCEGVVTHRDCKVFRLEVRLKLGTQTLGVAWCAAHEDCITVGVQRIRMASVFLEDRMHVFSVRGGNIQMQEIVLLLRAGSKYLSGATTIRLLKSFLIPIRRKSVLRGHVICS
jgi:hypothetical protein